MEGLFRLLHDSSQNHPYKTFIRYKNRDWTYREMEAASLRAASFILMHGAEKGDRVVLLCDNSAEYVAAYFGILACRAVAVPVNPAKGADHLAYIIEKCSPRLIIACSNTIGRINAAGNVLPDKIINIDECGIIDYPGNMACIDDAQVSTACEDDTALILFTSGTTAHPRGVALTHGNLLANTGAIVGYLGLTSEDSILMTLPFTYSYGNSVMLTHAAAGASIVIGESAAFPWKVLEDIKRNKVTGFSTVGSYISLMLKCIISAGADCGFLENLRYITLAGESVKNSDISFILHNYPNVRLYVMYGQTEAAARLSYLEPERLPEKIGSVGKGLCNVELRVVDESGEDVGPGVVGEIIARGPNIMKGYWEDPGATSDVLRDGWLYTGDYAVVDEDGYIYIRGRKTDMIKHMGHRISPAEIEEVIDSCSYVTESAVVQSTQDDIPIIKAFVVLSGDCSVEDIRRYVWSRLPVFMRPHKFEAIGRLPRTDTGKIMRSVLR